MNEPSPTEDHLLIDLNERNPESEACVLCEDVIDPQGGRYVMSKGSYCMSCYDSSSPRQHRPVSLGWS